MTGRQKVLVTGASGFLGSCLARRLLDRGHQVHVLVRSAGPHWRWEGIADRLHCHVADLLDESRVRDVVRGVRPDRLFHLAAGGTSGHPGGEENSRAILEANALGTWNLLNAARSIDLQSMVSAGSSSEYGHVDGPIREDQLPCPRTAYAVSKLAGTNLCLMEAIRGRPVVVIRVFSAYGEWEDPSRLASAVLRQCLDGTNPRVTSGRQPRDFIHADDVLDLFEIASQSPWAMGHVLHAGTGIRQTVGDMVQTILRVAGKGRLSAVYGAIPDRPDEPASWVASLDRTRELVDWRPKIDLQAGVTRMWDWLCARHAGSATREPVRQ